MPISKISDGPCPEIQGAISLAKLVGCEAEYTAMFKFMSKYVHPSSWLINKPVEETQSDTYRNILVIHAQLYAADSYERVREAFGVASDA